MALGQFTLKKFLYLVLFLDHAKLTRLIDHDPCLFIKTASIKVSYMWEDFGPNCRYKHCLQTGYHFVLTILNREELLFVTITPDVCTSFSCKPSSKFSLFLVECRCLWWLQYFCCERLVKKLYLNQFLSDSHHLGLIRKVRTSVTIVIKLKALCTAKLTIVPFKEARHLVVRTQT